MGIYHGPRRSFLGKMGVPEFSRTRWVFQRGGRTWFGEKVPIVLRVIFRGRFQHVIDGLSIYAAGHTGPSRCCRVDLACGKAIKGNLLIEYMESR